MMEIQWSPCFLKSSMKINVRYLPGSATVQAMDLGRDKVSRLAALYIFRVIGTSDEKTEPGSFSCLSVCTSVTSLLLSLKILDEKG